MKRFILALILLCAFAAAGAGISFWQFAHRPGPLAASIDYVVPRGSTARISHDLGVAKILPQGILAEKQFQLLTRLTASQGLLHAAELHFPAESSPLDVLAILRHGVPVSHHLTLAEGLTARQMTEILNQNHLLTGPTPKIEEGAMLPQTLSFERGAPRAQIVHRLEHLMDETLTRVWREREPESALKSPKEMLILASIVERETGNDVERPEVARVFLNRLAQGMKLQSDPTAIYDLSDGVGILDHSLTHDELHRLSPHNTYEIDGLPLGPICSPGLASLKAVAHPAAGNMLYFVADGAGRHKFTQDLREHNRSVAALRALRSLHPPQVAPIGSEKSGPAHRSH